jgi:hypothetical protein
MEHKRRRGAPRGNQNARKHGYYSSIITEKEKQALSALPHLTAGDAEITVLTLRLQSILEHDTANIRLIVRAFLALARLVLARCQLTNADDIQKVWGDLLTSLWHDIEKVSNGESLSPA